ncbi:MAG: TIGR03915 family putative DNA repair protein [Clostridia bacterium]|nr:TIGR03915 family putative DNA repair protein [Clostridia bacterium]
MIYFFDGTKEGFLTALVVAFCDENAFLTSKQKQLTLGEDCMFISADAQKAKKAEARLLQADKQSMSDLTTLLRSSDPNNAQIAFRYLQLVAKEKKPVRNMLANGDVVAATECMQRVTWELHRLKGFVRFMESASGALYAPLSPDHDICDLLLPHFRARLPEFPFVLHDVSRKKAAVYDGKNSFLAPLDRADVLLSADERAWQSLWRKYYQSVNIPSRERLKQMRGYLPVRYWKFLPEKFP